jgi:hypothetical protein
VGGSRAVLDFGAVFGWEETSDPAFRRPLNERCLGENGTATDAGYHGVDAYDGGV